MLTQAVKRALENIGIEIRRKEHSLALVPPELARIYERTKPYTMTSLERMAALYDAVRYLEANQIAGDFVECGVWRGGSAMNMALTLLECGSHTRHLYLFDTFAGMSEPTSEDVDVHGRLAQRMFDRSRTGESNAWCYAPLETVQQNMSSTGYPEDRLHLVKGKVEDTLPGSAPERIALLRLDTDWYESTRHELEHLFPRLVPGGVLILDDYGHWRGARKAADEYFTQRGMNPLLFRIDYTARMMLNGSAHSR
ncbi:MAG: TylF/MycF family methyltransferase [Myxococcota bacterium]|nr:class I SAM-dependent methyltransferase [Deltaproteobacteria bacterium]MDQ3339378.1 TylF/MycF family methyltransferase [Myxococcota bacterium]